MTDNNAKITEWKMYESIEIKIDVTLPPEFSDLELDDAQITDIAFGADLDTALEDAIAPFCEQDSLTYNVSPLIQNGIACVIVRGRRLRSATYDDRSEERNV